MKVKYIGKTDPCSLINGKIYECIGVENGWFRVIDEEGIDEEEDVQGYLYDQHLFEVVEL